MNTLQFLKSKIRVIPDFPKEGILFQDITTLLKDSEALNKVADALYEKYKDKNITQVVCIESRGFILGGILAYKLGAGFVPIRKKGKLPADTYITTYQLEYGEDSIELHEGALSEEDKVLLHDDLLATGGTTLAAIDLLKQSGVSNIEICFLMEISELEGRKNIPSEYEVFTLIK
ncbi:MAG: adenine phosphoribosyltransferase [Bacteroidales bacterium]|jgi:adenine phosphoribosyltransferase|nr:adenine phosphoribosyltransferase [Bacteroidales bacterium]